MDIVRERGSLTSTDKFSRRMVCRIVNYAQYHRYNTQNYTQCPPQRPAPEMLHSLWKPFGSYREDKEGSLSMFRVTISIHPLMAPTVGACDVSEQYFDNVVISVNNENQQTGISVVQ